MKKLNHTSIIIALILLSYRVQGQIYVPDSLTLEEAILQSNDTIFANIDSNSISTKILLNKCHIVDTNFVYAFDGVAGHSFDPEVLRNKFNDFLHITARLATHNQSLTDFAERVDKSMEHSCKTDQQYFLLLMQTTNKQEKLGCILEGKLERKNTVHVEMMQKSLHLNQIN